MRYFPEAIAEARLLLASEQCVSALASFEARDIGASADFEFEVETLIDMIAAGISAPVSPRALAALERD